MTQKNDVSVQTGSQNREPTDFKENQKPEGAFVIGRPSNT